MACKMDLYRSYHMQTSLKEKYCQIITFVRMPSFYDNIITLVVKFSEFT